jgi:hypothetical protein
MRKGAPRCDDTMKVERPPRDLTLPVPVKADGKPSSLLRSPKARSAYDAAGVIDTVEIRHNDFQPIPVAGKSKKQGAAGAVKGLYIDLWA